MSYWSYALINGRLGEIFFDRKRGKLIFEGHSYLRSDERFTIVEAKALQHDVNRTQLSYYRKQYHRK